MLIAEPVQNAGGCLVPPEGYWPGLRALCDQYGIALVADEVITGFGRIGEWFASSRYGVAPDLITCAKGITSAYAPMGAVIVSDKIAEPLYEDGRMLMHGITFAGHPVAAAIAQRNIEIFEREGVLENVRALEPYMGELLEGIKSRVPIVGDVRGAGFFWALELVRDADGVALLGRGAREAAARLPLRPAAGGGPDRPARRPRRRRPAPRAAADQHPRGARGDGREDRGRPGRRVRALLRRLADDPHRPRLLAGGGRRGRARAGAGRRGARRRRGHRRRLHRPVDGVAAARARALSVVRPGGRAVRPRAERAQRRVLRDAVDAPAVAGRALRPRRGRSSCAASLGGERRSRSARWCAEQGVDAWFTPRRLRDGVDRARPRRASSTRSSPSRRPSACGR